MIPPMIPSSSTTERFPSKHATRAPQHSPRRFIMYSSLQKIQRRSSPRSRNESLTAGRRDSIDSHASIPRRDYCLSNTEGATRPTVASYLFPTAALSFAPPIGFSFVPSLRTPPPPSKITRPSRGPHSEQTSVDLSSRRLVSAASCLERFPQSGYLWGTGGRLLGVGGDALLSHPLAWTVLTAGGVRLY